MKDALNFLSDPAELAQVRQRTRDFLSQAGIDECQSELIVLAVDEACTNIIRYAYHHEHKPVEMTMAFDQHTLRITLRDYGQSCDPSQIRSRDLEDIRPGGVGVHIIRKVFNQVSYEPMDIGTLLVLEKTF